MPLKKIAKKSKSFFSSVKEKIDDLKKKPKKSKSAKTHLPQEKTERMVVDISIWSATKIILIIFLLLFVQDIIVQLKDILITFFLSLFIAAAFNPGVDKLENKYKIPRWAGVIIIYLIVIAVLSLMIGTLVPIIIEQLSEMVIFLKDYLNNVIQNGSGDMLPEIIRPYVENVVSQIDQKEIIEQLQASLSTIAENLTDFAANAFGAITSVVDGIFNLILVVLLSFFMVVDKTALKEFFTSLFPKKYEKYIFVKTGTIQNKIGEWVHGQVALFFLVALIAYIGFSIIGLKYALTLALVAGFAEFLPYVGPLITFVVAAPVAFNQSLVTGISLIIFHVILQVFEGNILLPLVMKKATGLSPIVTIIALLIGWQFLGVIGMILSVPLASIATIFVNDFREHQK